MRRRKMVLDTVVLALSVAIAACGADVKSKDPEPRSAGTAEAAPPPSAAPARPSAPPAAPAVLASQESNTDPDLRCDVLEVKRVRGGALLIKWRVGHVPGAPSTGLTAQEPKKIHFSWGWADVYVTDPAENKKYMGLRDSGGAWIAQGWDKYYAPGERQLIWMKFPAPPETSTRISFVFPGFAPFEDLPVAP